MNVGEANGAKAVDVYALVPKVPPVPMLRVDPSVPAKVKVLDEVKVFPTAMFKVLVPLAVMVRPLTVVGVIAPKVKAKAPAVLVADTPLPVVTDDTNVPEVGRVTDVAPVTASVVPKAPDIVKVEAALFATPVPPLAGDNIPATSPVAKSTAFVVEPVPINIDAVNVSDI